MTLRRLICRVRTIHSEQFADCLKEKTCNTLTEVKPSKNQVTKRKTLAHYFLSWRKLSFFSLPNLPTTSLEKEKKRDIRSSRKFSETKVQNHNRHGSGGSTRQQVNLRETWHLPADEYFWGRACNSFGRYHPMKHTFSFLPFSRGLWGKKPTETNREYQPRSFCTKVSAFPFKDSRSVLWSGFLPTPPPQIPPETRETKEGPSGRQGPTLGVQGAGVGDGLGLGPGVRVPNGGAL